MNLMPIHFDKRLIRPTISIVNFADFSMVQRTGTNANALSYSWDLIYKFSCDCVLWIGVHVMCCFLCRTMRHERRNIYRAAITVTPQIRSVVGEQLQAYTRHEDLGLTRMVFCNSQRCIAKLRKSEHSLISWIHPIQSIICITLNNLFFSLIHF